MKKRIRIFAALFAAGGAIHVEGGTSSWLANQNGSWSVNGNWLGGAPVSGDNALVSSGVGTVNQNFNLNNFLFTGGQIAGANSITTSGTFSWSGSARLGGGGTLNSDGTMLISGSIVPNGRTINNAATGLWSGGDIQLLAGSVTALNNLAGATFTIQSDNSILQSTGGSLTLSNSGTLVKNTTTGLTFLRDATVNNSGTIDVESGTLSLGFPGGTSSGTFNVAAGAALVFGNYTFGPGTTVTGGGTVSVGIGGPTPTGGIQIDTNLTVANLKLASIQTSIDGTSRLSVGHEFDWQGGNLLGSGTMQINTGATLNMSAALNTATTLFRNIDNLGTINWSGTASLEIGQGAVFNNSGVWNFTADQSLIRNLPFATFNNTGTLSKSAGVGSTMIGAMLNNTGNISVTSGMLSFAAGGTSELGSAFTVGSGATLQFGGEGFWMKSGTIIGGSGTIENIGALRISTAMNNTQLVMNGSELGIDGDLDDNQFAWNQGEITGPGTTKLTADRTFALPWGVGSGRTLDTNGHDLTWNDGFFGSGLGTSVFGFTGAGTILNRSNSTFAINLGSQVFQMVNGMDVVNIENAGTFMKNNGAAIQVSGALNNSGTVQVNGGALTILGGGDSSGTFTGMGNMLFAGASQNLDAASTIDSLSVYFQAASATLTNTATAAYNVPQLIVGDFNNDASKARLTVKSGVSVSVGSLTALAGSTLALDGGGISASDSVILDNVSSNEDGGIFITNNGSISATTVLIRHATLDVQSGTILASGSFDVEGGTVNFGGGAHLTTSDMKLIGGTVNVSPGFSWPTQDISISGSTVNLQPGVNYNLGAANISGGGINVGGGASLQVDSMLHAGFSEIDGTLNVMHELDNEGFLKASSGASISAGMVSMGGIIDLFDGTLTSAGDMNLNGSSVLIAEVDASGSSVHAGRIEVGGTATLAGALGLSFVNDSVLLPHQSIEVMH
ncbi:MAG TPA: hypothetical protein VHS31_18465, partial [Tepidisphaeraceae bacterium]|nr:hypothetical protein [Tepidisphaeraceae bacterium]